MKEKFIQFLKDNNAYGAFIKNCIIYGSTTIDSIIKNWTDNPEKWISMTFIWVDTSEGYAYWRGIDQAWKIILNKED